MDNNVARRFDTEFAPRIAAKIASLFRAGEVETEVLPRESAERPTRVRIGGVPLKALRGYTYRLNVYLVWHDKAVIELVTHADENSFGQYLETFDKKMEAWQITRKIDFGSRTQAEISILINGLDFEAYHHAPSF